MEAGRIHLFYIPIAGFLGEKNSASEVYLL